MSEPMADNRIWERLPTDTNKSFEAFAIYRDLGANRSLSKVGEVLGKSGALIERWSTANDWTNRVAAFDKSLDEKNLDENAERQKLIKDNAYADYEFLRKAIDKTKRAYLEIDFSKVPSYEIGNLVELMKKADDYARRAVGLPDKITENKTDTTIKGNLNLSWEEMFKRDDTDSTD
jgi:hypothetical protein